MRKHSSKYVSVLHWGDVYRLTQGQWAAYLRAIAAGDIQTSPASYGHYALTIYRDVTHIDSEAATRELSSTP